MEKYIISFFVAAVISMFMTPISKKIAIKVGAIDIPKDERRIHKKPIPLLGGLAIYTATMISILIFLPMNKSLLSIIIGGTIIFISGIIDDKKNLSAKTKLIFQLLAAVVLILGDVKIDFITNPFSRTSTLLYLKGFSIPLTIFWVVGITNTLNLIDGLDGLAAGVAMIASLSLLIVANRFGYIEITIISAILAGSCLGFLPYNFNPAKIFMGDTGALFLGFMLSVVAIEGVMKSVATIAIVVPIIILGLPIFDTTFAIFRRLLNGRPIMEADKGHLHHRLLQRGLTQRQTVLILYLISAVFGFAAVIIAKINSRQGIIISGTIIILTILLARRMGLIDKSKNSSVDDKKR
ncbi:undecaprenyl/decaprenyl-phosphate alpha-N-acetylglucosaminyl 1-phosphate transferase [Acidilutibacter cellobiosedens]|jgi:UDP-GlcNAc:undecaprenyl-phosphate GlcNAc-1-phosphate transferase|uniref:Undecaprenyl/decaprenyl-phosphate alpha-N-acetylglucosaminyl 1-phosphate transferase n=1 Tax=Acidilutibacter cellobiosedens TaxID=2507161 RepID=A0A410Q9J6_9FIRM|nr:MraY family glycosyltransferase [Acidilutibacter cellobiosedens]MBE6081819.1 undecaprenyl/decaprenyl-phosphate alpha-N-acetylglucosaminyl 1-phosphate transferase [Tissierellaceae bacterium]QAT60657.1 undecaprenyl/decaprenyl-phosphate alpha-N-acetylglucosaminyl 1-phosphate transferase [Acidilutibacter cellobiosedens]